MTGVQAVNPAPPEPNCTSDPGNSNCEPADERRLADDTERLADYTGYLATLTGVLCLIAIAQAGLFLWQLGYMKIGLSVSGTAARAAELNAQAVINSEMAFCLMEQVRLVAKKATLESGTSFQPKFRTFIRNAGRTPGFVGRATLYFKTIEEAPEFQIGPPNRERGGVHDHGYFLGPNQLRPAADDYGDAWLTGEELVALRSGKFQLFVWGEIEFRTILPENWVSGFAYQIRLSGDFDDNGMLPQKNVSLGGHDLWRLEKQTSGDSAR